VKVNENPFAFGKVVKGKQFFDRKKEKAEISRAILDGQNLILFAPRRYGKTSLMLNVLDELKKADNSFSYFFVDFYKINSVVDFLTIMTNEYAKNSGLTFERILTTLKKIIRGVVPSVSIDEMGKPKIELSVSPKTIVPAFEDVMKLPEKLSKGKKRTAVFFDEFQEVVSLNGFDFQKKLRAVIQHQKKTSYIFCGSKQHLFQNIFTNPNNPLFKIGEAKYLDIIPENEFVKFIHSNFKKIRSDFDKENARKVFTAAGKIPYNVQFFRQ